MKEYGDLNGDEDEIESARQEKEDNNPNHEPNFDDEIKSLKQKIYKFELEFWEDE